MHIYVCHSIIHMYCSVPSTDMKLICMNESCLTCVGSSFENGSEFLYSVSLEEPSSSRPEILFLSRSSCGGGDNTTRIRPIIHCYSWMPSYSCMDATPLSILNDASPIVCSKSKTCPRRVCNYKQLPFSTKAESVSVLLEMFHVAKEGSTHLLNGEKVCQNAFLAMKEEMPGQLSFEKQVLPRLLPKVERLVKQH